MKKNLLIALGIVLMLFAFTACSNDNSSRLDQTEAADIATKINPVELINDALAGEIKNATVTFREPKAASTLIATVEFDNATYNGMTISSGRLSYTLTGEFTGSRFNAATYSVTTEVSLSVAVAGGTSSAMDISIPETTATTSVFSANVTVEADGSATATNVRASMTLSSGSSVTVGGNDVTDEVPSVPDEDTPDDPVVVNNWPISVSIGSHPSHPANKNAEVSYSNGVITVTTPLSDLDSYLSDNAAEAEKGAAKWIGLLISVDGVDIKSVSYGDHQIGDDDVTEATGAGGDGDDFVLWIRAEEVLTTPKTFTLSRAGVEDITVTVNVVDNSEIPTGLQKATPNEDWVTDRTEPKVWEITDGKIHIESNEESSTEDFVRYQGRKATTNVPLTGYWKISSTYTVDESLANVENGQVSIWANTQDAEGTTVDWTIVGISFNGSVVSWDSDGDGTWNKTDESIAPITDGDEIDIVIEFNNGLIKQYIDGECVSSYDVGEKQTKPFEVFIQLKNSDQSNSYSADWTVPVIEYASV